MSDDRNRPKHGRLFPDEETTGVQVLALRREIQHVAETAEIDARQLHERISSVSKEVTNLTIEFRVSQQAQTDKLDRLIKAEDERRAEEQAEREAKRKRELMDAEAHNRLQLETAKIGRTRLTSRAKIILGLFGLLGAGIGAGVKLVAILHGG